MQVQVLDYESRNREPKVIGSAILCLNKFYFGEGEIKTGIIGQYIMEALSSLDQVAYVRFASVYKNFREVKDFEDFLGNLEDK